MEDLSRGIGNVAFFVFAFDDCVCLLLLACLICVGACEL